MLKGLYSGRKIKATTGKLTRTQTGAQAYKAIVKKYGKIVDSAKYKHVGKGNWVRYSIENDRKRTGKVTTSLDKWREQPHKLDYRGKDTKGSGKTIPNDNYKYVKFILMNNPIDETMLKYVSGKQKASDNIIKRTLNGIPQKTWIKAFKDLLPNVIIEIRGGKNKRSSFLPYSEYCKIKDNKKPNSAFAISQIKQAKPMGRNVRKQEMKHKPVLKTTEKMIEAKLLPLDVMRDAKIVKGVLTKKYKNIKFTVTSRKVWHGKNYGNGGAIDITYQSPNEIPEIDKIAQRYRKTIKFGLTGRKLNMPLRINLFVNHVKGPYKTTKYAPKTNAKPINNSNEILKNAITSKKGYISFIAILKNKDKIRDSKRNTKEFIKDLNKFVSLSNVEKIGVVINKNPEKIIYYNEIPTMRKKIELTPLQAHNKIKSLEQKAEKMSKELHKSMENIPPGQGYHSVSARNKLDRYREKQAKISAIVDEADKLRKQYNISTN